MLARMFVFDLHTVNTLHATVENNLQGLLAFAQCMCGWNV